MGGGLKFLNLKGWHPSNKQNQKKIWIAEQRHKAKEESEKDAAREVLKDNELLRFQQVAATRGDADASRRIDSQKVSFLYQPPPGLKKVDDKRGGDTDELENEDDAVKAFRLKMEKKNAGKDHQSYQRPLEKLIGRRANDPVTIKDQVERFPMLKDAPVEGEYTQNIKVNFQPVGMKLRNVRCARCQVWGHQSGDRECEMRDQNPNGTDMTHESDDPERKYLASLSTKEKKQLLKKLKRESNE
ncbi:hypothetical protein DYB28_000819 [Aphanomyces astaci]|uniref:CBF1-interacting co-repressor CIR N-terminal domain-containing protein n=1 Tax=Aphanomyces astaci TaxID=112090 RepID=A0A9X8EC91_APHAT|nr:hypothetical protein DYB28_000819 [Aphanomyces astaci]